MTLTPTVDQSHRSLMDFHAMPSVANASASGTASDQSTSAAAESFASALAVASSSTPSAAAPAASTVTPANQIGTAVQLGTPTPSATPVAAQPAPTVDPPVPTTDPNEAYWASQPAPVQVLQTMTDPAQRYDAGMALARQGYKIDVPIMLWGWNPVQTMQFRQNMGYTWVPSALQNPVQVAPGLTFPGLSSYDPSSPPPGSIPVTTNFLSPIFSTTS